MHRLLRFVAAGLLAAASGGFPSQRPVLFAGGLGGLRFRNFRYRALP